MAHDHRQQQWPNLHNGVHVGPVGDQCHNFRRNQREPAQNSPPFVAVPEKRGVRIDISQRFGEHLGLTSIEFLDPD